MKKILRITALLAAIAFGSVAGAVFGMGFMALPLVLAVVVTCYTLGRETGERQGYDRGYQNGHWEGRHEFLKGFNCKHTIYPFQPIPNRRNEEVKASGTVQSSVRY